LLDAVVAGEGDGPLRPEPRAMRTLIFGEDPGLVDVFASALSGVDWRSIPVLAHLADPEAGAITSFDADGTLPSKILELKAPAAWRWSRAEASREAA
jgi:uncharacterized protein (DUF362 family)